MSAIKVKEYLKKYNMDKRIVTFDTPSATVKEAADNLHCEEKRIAKTLSFTTKNGYILIVMAGDKRCDNHKYKEFFQIDNKKYRDEFKEKAHMLPNDIVEEVTGHPVGGVCPFAINEEIKIYLDVSLKRFETVFPACGSNHNAIEISLEELEEVVPYVNWVDVCKEKDCQ